MLARTHAADFCFMLIGQIQGGHGGAAKGTWQGQTRHHQDDCSGWQKVLSNSQRLISKAAVTLALLMNNWIFPGAKLGDCWGSEFEVWNNSCLRYDRKAQNILLTLITWSTWNTLQACKTWLTWNTWYNWNIWCAKQRTFLERALQVKCPSSSPQTSSLLIQAQSRWVASIEEKHQGKMAIYIYCQTNHIINIIIRAQMLSGGTQRMVTGWGDCFI